LISGPFRDELRLGVGQVNEDRRFGVIFGAWLVKNPDLRSESPIAWRTVGASLRERLPSTKDGSGIKSGSRETNDARSEDNDCLADAESG
jgi:hypothetical protein